MTNFWLMKLDMTGFSKSTRTVSTQCRLTECSQEGMHIESQVYCEQHHHMRMHER